MACGDIFCLISDGKGLNQLKILKFIENSKKAHNMNITKCVLNNQI